MSPRGFRSRPEGCSRWVRLIRTVGREVEHRSSLLGLGLVSQMPAGVNLRSLLHPVEMTHLLQRMVAPLTHHPRVRLLHSLAARLQRRNSLPCPLPGMQTDLRLPDLISPASSTQAVKTEGRLEGLSQATLGRRWAEVALQPGGWSLRAKPQPA